jgi:hypothetical protein
VSIQKSRFSAIPEDLGRETLATITAWALFCVTLSTKTPILFEADDYAYRASIIALKNGLIVLSQTQYTHLNSLLKGRGVVGIYQWTHLTNGNWISQKNPGFPFLAEPFYLIGNLRLLPAFYALLAVLGIFLGARKWLGSGGGFVASVCFLFTGASLTYGYRVTMPTFTEACLIGCGLGLLIWSSLAESSSQSKNIVSCVAFALLGCAVFSRYTNAVIYVGVLVVLLVVSNKFGFSRRAVVNWLAITGLLAIGILEFNHRFYGGWLNTGYSGQKFSTSLANYPENVTQIPIFLVEAMPVVLIAIWAGIHIFRRSKRRLMAPSATVDNDRMFAILLVVSTALLWALYFGYNRTAVTLYSTAAIHVVRFYVPALAPLALLAAWQLMKLNIKWRVGILVLLVVTSFWSFQSLTKQTPPLPGQPGGPPLWSKTPLTKAQ